MTNKYLNFVLFWGVIYVFCKLSEEVIRLTHYKLRNQTRIFALS